MNVPRVILWTLVLMTLGLQWRLWVGEGSFAHVKGLRDEADKMAWTNKRKRLRNEILKAEILDLRNGLEAVEEKARSELGFIRKGEVFYLVVDDPR